MVLKNLKFDLMRPAETLNEPSDNAVLNGCGTIRNTKQPLKLQFAH